MMHVSSYPAYVGSTNPYDQAIDSIARALEARTAEFLFGAGMSKPSNVPVGEELNRKLLKTYFPTSGELPPPSDARSKALARKYPLEILAEAALRKPGSGETSFTRELRGCLFDDLKTDLKAHEHFEGICLWEGEPRVDRIFTTNFDTLLERQFGPRRICTIDLNNSHELAEKMRKPQLKLPVIHLHGTLDGEYIITESQTMRSLAGSSKLRTAFENALDSAAAFVFVGYSLNDLDFRLAYLKIQQNIRDRPTAGPQGSTTFIVSPPDDEYDFNLGSKLWMARGAFWIPLDALTFFQKLRRCLEHQFGEVDLVGLRKKYRIADDKVLLEKVGRVSEMMAVSTDDAIQFMFLSKGQR